MIVETDYPGCILDRDKIRLYKQSSTSMTRPKYVGEQRVIRVRKHLRKHFVCVNNTLLYQGDKAVVFPCSMFNISSHNDVFCFYYISTSLDGSVNTVQTNCLPVQDNNNNGKLELAGTRQRPW